MIDVYKLADAYFVDNLKAECETLIRSTKSFTNLVQWAIWSNKTSLTSLYAVIMETISADVYELLDYNKHALDLLDNHSQILKDLLLQCHLLKKWHNKHNVNVIDLTTNDDNHSSSSTDDDTWF
jgi:hypothetical protein